MSSSPFRFRWPRWHRRSAQGLERLWRPTVATRVQHPVKRRRRTLLAITMCLHVLLWSSVIPLVTMLALFATHNIDRTILPSTVLTIVSAVASFSYIVLHSIVARRHSRLQHGFASRKIENACYFAIRHSVMLCILWLLTSGWNFIVAARQPICLPQSFSNDFDDGWKVGGSCIAERFSAAISFIALAASCALFGILAVARRPFEASLLGFSLSALTDNNDINHPQYQSRKLPHPEDGVYNPALRRAADMSTSTLTSLTASSFFRPDTAMTERTTATSILNGGLVGSTPGPSFPPSPSTGDAVVGARQHHHHHFNWVHGSPPPLPLRSGTNNPPPLPPPPLLLPAAPIVSVSTTTARRVSSAESRYTPRPSLASPYQHQRSKSYGQSMPLLSASIADSPTSSPPRLVPARPARSSPPLDSAWRAMHPNPPGVSVVVGGGTTGYGNDNGDESPPATASAAQGSLHVSRKRAKVKTRPPSMPHSPPRMTSWMSSTTTPTPTSSGGWTAMAAVNEERGSVGSLALTTAALARLTAEQHAYRQTQQHEQQQQQQQMNWNHNDTVGSTNGIARRGRSHAFGHRRIPTPSGPPPSMPISVRPVVDDDTARTAVGTSTTTSSNHNNPASSSSNGRPATPINQIRPSAHPSSSSSSHPPHNHHHHPHASNSALLSLLQHRAARQRPLRWSSRRSLSGDDVNNSNHSSSSSLGSQQQNRRSSSCGTSSPLSTTMVRACEVDAEVLREEIEEAERMRREAFGGGDVEEEEEEEDEEKGLGVEVVEQVRGLERSGRWCRVRRGFGVGGGAGAGGRKKKKTAAVVVDEEGGDLGIEGRNWVRNASGDESLAGKSDDGVESGREDSGVQWEITVTAPPEQPGSLEPEQKPEPEPERKKRGLLPSWGNGIVAGKSPEQSFLEAVLAAGKVSPLLLQQQQFGDEDDATRLSQNATVVRRRARSVEGTRQEGPKGSANGGTMVTAQAMEVGLGLSCVIGVGSGTVQQGKEAGLLGVKRAPRTRRKTVVLG